jgi:hypothetical protein
MRFICPFSPLCFSPRHFASRYARKQNSALAPLPPLPARKPPATSRFPPPTKHSRRSHHGAKPGPVALVSGAHGAEYVSIIAIEKLIALSTLPRDRSLALLETRKVN